MIPFLDVHKINARFKTKFQQKLNAVIDQSQYILGNHVEAFEDQFANYCNTKHCIGVASGLDALTLILKAYIKLEKLKKGDKVLVPANTFIATILSVLHAELEPVFIEPNPKTFNIETKRLETYVSNDVKALVMVHLYGQLADIETLKTFTKTHNLLLIADAAQAHGAALHGDKAGSFAEAAAFSFYPSKNLGALGDGGAITTNDSALNNTIRLLRNYGSTKKYVNKLAGFNSRLDDIQAAFLSIKLKHLDNDNIARRQIAMRYLTEIKNPLIKLPFYNRSKNHVFYAFVVCVKHRAHFTKYLNTHHIGWLIHYPIPPHKQNALQQFAKLQLPITEQLASNIVSLPISPLMTTLQVTEVINIINNYKFYS